MRLAWLLAGGVAVVFADAPGAVAVADDEVDAGVVALDGGVVAVDVDVLDEGAVAGQFGEVEVELVDGDPAVLDAIAEVLRADSDIRPARRSKVETALAAVQRARAANGRTRHRPANPRARPEVAVPATSAPGVTASDALAEAGRKVLRFHFARLLARERAVSDPDNRDIEDVHAMRVAVRRMRAAWRFFDDTDGPRTPKRLRNRLRRLGDRLGAVRDLDVLLDGAATYLERGRSRDAAGLAPLLDAWRRERASAQRRLVAVLGSRGYRAWQRDFAAYVLAAEDVAAAPAASRSRLRDRAGSRLWGLYETVRAYEETVPSADIATLHALRIDGKRLRYGLEFLREVLGRDSAPLIADVVALQDHVGALHDADVAATRARAMLAESADRLGDSERAAIGRYLESRERELDRLRRTARRPFERVTSPAFGRGLARIVADL